MKRVTHPNTSRHTDLRVEVAAAHDDEVLDPPRDEELVLVQEALVARLWSCVCIRMYIVCQPVNPVYRSGRMCQASPSMASYSHISTTHKTYTSTHLEVDPAAVLLPLDQAPERRRGLLLVREVAAGLFYFRVYISTCISIYVHGCVIGRSVGGGGWTAQYPSKT